MKISIIMDKFESPYAGTESQVLKLILGLKNMGVEVRCAVCRGSEFTRKGGFPLPIEDLGVGSISNPLSWLKAFRYGRRIRSDGYAISQCYFNDSSLIFPPMLRLAGVTPLISRRDMGFWYTFSYKWVLRLTGLFVRAVICNSQAVAEITQTIERIPAKKVHVIYNGFSENSAEIVADSSHSRSQEERPIVVGIVANLKPIKRIDDLIRAFGLLIDMGCKVELQIVGGGDTSPYIELVQKLGVEDQVMLLGRQSDPGRFIQNFDIAVLCSESEGFSNSIIEYMRFGKPVVCTRAGGNPEIVIDGHNGYLVTVGDIEELKNRLFTLVRDPDLRKKMGREGAAIVKERYSVDKMLSEHMSLYRSLIDVRDVQ